MVVRAKLPDNEPAQDDALLGIGYRRLLQQLEAGERQPGQGADLDPGEAEGVARPRNVLPTHQNDDGAGGMPRERKGDRKRTGPQRNELRTEGAHYLVNLGAADGPTPAVNDNRNARSGAESRDANAIT